MWKNRLLWGLVILLSAALLIHTNSYYALWLFLACLLIPLSSLLFMLFAARHLKMELILPPIMEKGEDTSFFYHLKNDSRFPIARLEFDTILENQMTYSLSKSRHLASVKGKGSCRQIFRIEDPLTGTMIVSTGRIRIEDAFGIFSVKKEDLPEEATVIYPAFREIEVYLNEPVETLGDGRRFSQDKKGNDVSEIFAVRDYEEGDEIRSIHWKLTEKMDKTIVRDFSLPLNYSIFLLLDLTKAEEEVMDRALEYYVSISRVLMEKGIHHNLAWFDGADKILHVHELKVYGDMEFAISEMLTACASQEQGVALDHYLESVYCNPRSTLLYVGTRPDLEKLEEISMRQSVRIIDAQEESIDEVWV